MRVDSSCLNIVPNTGLLYITISNFDLLPLKSLMGVICVLRYVTVRYHCT